jgi:hypothetical protein
MVPTPEYARLSSHDFSTIVNRENQGKYLFDTISNINILSEKGKGMLYFSGFATPERSQMKPKYI